MSIAAMLVGYAVALGVVGPRVLRRLKALDRLPRLGIAVWIAALWSAVVGLVLAGMTAAFDSAVIRDAVADLIRACVGVFHYRYVTTPTVAVAGLAIAVLTVGWLILHLVLLASRNRAVRRRHAATLDLVGYRDDQLGVTVVDHSAVCPRTACQGAALVGSWCRRGRCRRSIPRNSTRWSRTRRRM